MKRYLIILTLGLFSFTSFAQDEEQNEKIRDRMKEFIQKRLGLSRSEADRFSPVFVRYFQEWRQTLRDNRDVLVRQQKIAELRIRYRSEFTQIVGEKRSNAIFKEQERFIQELKQIRKERMDNRQSQPKRLNGLNN